ncbi:MAG: ATPase [Sphingomonas bacterium]|jgi:uncharacterized protein YndB with AHSA1/START domain|nr:ATPase [Sphingomonas bacterium]
MDPKPDRVFVTYIAAAPDRVWALLVDPVRSAEWFFGYRLIVSPVVGGAFEVFAPDGGRHIWGEVLAIAPGRRLRVSWQDAITGQPPIEVEWRIDPNGDATRLAVHEYHRGATVPDKFMEAGREGWSLILATMKTMIETGRAFPPVMLEQPK